MGENIYRDSESHSKSKPNPSALYEDARENLSKDDTIEELRKGAGYYIDLESKQDVMEEIKQASFAGRAIPEDLAESLAHKLGHPQSEMVYAIALELKTQEDKLDKAA